MRSTPTSSVRHSNFSRARYLSLISGSVGLDGTAAVAVDTIAAPEGATTTTVAVDPMTEEESNAE
jgi:hypothetical protein